MLELILTVLVFAAVIVLFRFFGLFVVTGGDSEEKIASKYKGTEAAQSVFVKKYPEANVNARKNIILALGFVFSMGTAIYALTWTSSPPKTDLIVEGIYDDDFIMEPPPTEQKKPPPPPPPPPEIEVVEDDEILEEEPEIEDIEVDENEEIEVPEVIEEVVEAPEIFRIVEEMPRYKSCKGKTDCESKSTMAEKQQCAQLELMKYLNTITYPPMAVDNDIEGKVFVQFVVRKDGKISDVAVAYPGTADKILEDAALLHIKNMCPWTPGKQRGKSVDVHYGVPINFKLG